MFNGVIDSTEVRRAQRGSSSRSSGVSVHRSSQHDLEMARLREELRQRDEFLQAQQEHQRAQQEYYGQYQLQQQAAIQVSR